jgi:hypothetical protein
MVARITARDYVSGRSVSTADRESWSRRDAFVGDKRGLEHDGERGVEYKRARLERAKQDHEPGSPPALEGAGRDLDTAPARRQTSTGTPER